MKIQFIDVKYKGEVKLTSEIINKLKNKKYKKIAIYTTVQFLDNLPFIVKQLKKEGINIITSKPDRAFKEGQVLGCDVYKGNLNLKEKVDAFLFIGYGEFHVNALLFAGVKEVYAYNPTNNKLRIYNEKDIEKIMQRKKANIKRFLLSDNVGVIVSIKPGQGHYHYIEKLKKKFPPKKFYIFLCDNINFQVLENFPFIEAWINTACPRIGLEDALDTSKAIVNAEDVLKI